MLRRMNRKSSTPSPQSGGKFNRKPFGPKPYPTHTGKGGDRPRKPYTASQGVTAHALKVKPWEREKNGDHPRNPFDRKPYAERSGNKRPFSRDTSNPRGEFPRRDLPPKFSQDRAFRPHESAPSSAKTDWGHVARWYDEHLASKDTYHQTVVLPNILRLVAPKKDEIILDVPCGNGYFARAFAKEGAMVIAIDLGRELVAHASRESSPGVRYFVASSDKLPMAHDASVDKAAVMLGIQNIKNVDGTFAEIARALKQGGELHIVMNHPVFRIPRSSSWGWDKERGLQYRRIDAYLSETEEAIDMHPGKTAEGAAPTKTVSFHRPLQWYFKLLGKHGFAVDRLEEWISDRKSDSGPRAGAENRARHEFPLFMYLRAKKLA